MTDARIVIRKARPEDAEAILAYLRRIGGETDNLSFGAEGLPLSVYQERDYLEGLSSDKKSVLFTAWKDGVLIGDGSLSQLPRRMSHRAELGISVVRSEWGHGVGSLLMERLVEFAKASGTELVHLEVRADNERAIRLYERFGFRTVGVFPAYFKIQNDYHDFRIMVLDLR